MARMLFWQNLSLLFKREERMRRYILSLVFLCTFLTEISTGQGPLFVGKGGLLDMDDKSITIKFKKEEIEFIRFDIEKNSPEPDLIYFKDKKEGIKGKVIEVSESYVVIRFSRMNEGFREKEEERPEELRKEPEIEKEEIKEMIKEEVMTQVKDQIQKAMIAEKEKEEPVERGDVTGRMLSSGRPLPNCRVKIAKILQADSFFGIFKEIKVGVVFEGTTDNDGTYKFLNVPAGKYKILWKPSSEKTWVRRLRLDPDVEVEKDKVNFVKDIEVRKKVF